MTFSGDKVLGGPQAGLHRRRARWIEQIAKNPLHRAVRCGKLTIAALEATLRLYRSRRTLHRDIPALRAFTRPLDEIDQTARRAVTPLAEALGPGSASPMRRLDVADRKRGAPDRGDSDQGHRHPDMTAAGAERSPRGSAHARPPIIGRIKDGAFLLDVRTIDNPDDLIPRFQPANPPTLSIPLSDETT